MMKTIRSILALLIILAISTLSAQANVNISGENSATYTYKTAKDSLHHYFEDELSMRLDQGNFTFGMTFRANLPRYNQFDPIGELRPDSPELYTTWVDRYIQLTFDDFRVKGGTLDETFGAGIVLRAYNDVDNYKDKRLEGVQARYFLEYGDDASLKVSGVYGTLQNEIQEEFIYKNDMVIGGDIEVIPLEFLKIGGSAVEYKQGNAQGASSTNATGYIHHDIYGGRVDLMFDALDFKAEYAERTITHSVLTSSYIPAKTKGTAIYASANVYLGDLTLNGGYKNYENYQNDGYFNYSLTDLPTLNHYDELLTSFYLQRDGNLIKREEGLQGEVQYNLGSDTEITINYAESWNQNFKVRHSDTYTELKHNFGDVAITAEYEHVEKYDKLGLWIKELRPALLMDIDGLIVPLTIKLAWNYEKEKTLSYVIEHHKPYIQVDTKIVDNLSISLSAEYPMEDFTDIEKNKIYLGGELVTSISDHTEVKLFAGKESGGKVCRNGTCSERAPFEGLKLSLVTKF